MARLRRCVGAWCLCCALVLAAHAASQPADSVITKPLHAARAPDPLLNPCDSAMRAQAPVAFALRFGTNYGTFVAKCERARAPVWVDRIYNLATHGYYDDNFFFRVLRTDRLSIAQFGTSGVPSVSNIYNWSSTTTPECAILEPQPPDMPRCMAGEATSGRCAPLSNTFGTIAMSTSSTTTPAYPDGVTWNATAELFINLGDNSWLDALLFVPVCKIDREGMAHVQRFPSFGEVADLGGPGPSLGMLYQEGNSYIRANKTWREEMGVTTHVTIEPSASNAPKPDAAASGRAAAPGDGAAKLLRVSI